jgi:hypothetical protein
MNFDTEKFSHWLNKNLPFMYKEESNHFNLPKETAKKKNSIYANLTNKDSKGSLLTRNGGFSSTVSPSKNFGATYHNISGFSTTASKN